MTKQNLPGASFSAIATAATAATAQKQLLLLAVNGKGKRVFVTAVAAAATKWGPKALSPASGENDVNKAMEPNTDTFPRTIYETGVATQQQSDVCITNQSFFFL